MCIRDRSKDRTVLAVHLWLENYAATLRQRKKLQNLCYMTPLRRRIYTAARAVVGVIDVLEHSCGLFPEQFRSVALYRQALIQQFFDGYPYLSAGLLALSPIQHQFARLERGQ